jgi:hypothetical protein
VPATPFELQDRVPTSDVRAWPPHKVGARLRRPFSAEGVWNYVAEVASRCLCADGRPRSGRSIYRISWATQKEETPRFSSDVDGLGVQSPFGPTC